MQIKKILSRCIDDQIELDFIFHLRLKIQKNLAYSLTIDFFFSNEIEHQINLLLAPLNFY